MVPGEMEIKALRSGQKVYRLRNAGDWAQAFAEIRDWAKISGGFPIPGTPGKQ